MLLEGSNSLRMADCIMEKLSEHPLPHLKKENWVSQKSEDKWKNWRIVYAAAAFFF